MAPAPLLPQRLPGQIYPGGVGRAHVRLDAEVLEELALIAVPVSVEQGLALPLGEAGKPCQIPGIVLEQDAVVEDGAGDEGPAQPLLLAVSVGVDHHRLLPQGLHGRSRGDEALLHPGVTHAAGVCGAAHVDPGPRPVGAVAAFQVDVLLKAELGQLVEGDEVESLALVVELVPLVLQGAEDHLGPAGEGPGMPLLVIPGAGEGRGVIAAALFDELCELGIGLAQDQPLVIGNVHLPRGFDDQGVALAAAGGTAIEHLILAPLHKDRLPLLRLPDHIAHVLPLPASFPVF